MLVLEHFFFLDMGLGLDIRWAEVAKSFGPTIFKMHKIYLQYNNSYIHFNFDFNFFFK